MKVANVSIMIVLLGCLLTGCRKSPNSRNISRNSVVMVEDNAESKGKEESEECSAVPKKRSLFGNLGFGFDLGKLFGNFGFEELLIVGLIFLIAQSEGNEDIILLLILLFFIN